MTEMFHKRYTPSGWEACVALDCWEYHPERIYCRPASSIDGADALLRCLKRHLVDTPAVAEVIDAWWGGRICREKHVR